MRRLLPLLLLGAAAVPWAAPASAERPRSPAPSTVTIRAADIARDPMEVTRRMQARGLRVSAFVDPGPAGTILAVQSHRVLRCDCNSSPHDDFDEQAERRAELARLRTVVVGRDWVRIPADYAYDLQVHVGR